jgi:PHD/YefM family antitoxin component YafN of YafNO toxin-antitoxin module
MNTTDAANLSFLRQLETSEGQEKVAALGQSYLRDRLREDRFMGKILPPRTVKPSECQPSVGHDGLVYMDEVEPDSKAVAITFRGEADATYVDAERYEIPFYMTSSDEFQKTTQELQAIKMPIWSIIKKNVVKDIKAVQDYHFLRHVQSAVETTGQTVYGEQATAEIAARGNATGFRGKLQRGDVVTLKQSLTGSYREAKVVLLNEQDADDMLRWTIEDRGDKSLDEINRNGLGKDATLFGLKLVRTIKVDILQTGNIYAFTSPEFLGKFLLLNSTQFYAEKRAYLITMKGWEDVGVGIGNIYSCAKMKLYTAASDDTFNAEDSIFGPRTFSEGTSIPAVER